jgi:hypothetical protein
MKFDELMYQKIKGTIQKWPEDICRDIYAISFFIYDADDDPRCPTLTLGYNTNEQLKSVASGASDTGEVKWNYAFWLQNVEAVVGDKSDEPLRERWIRGLGLWYEDEMLDEDFDRTLELDEVITKKFVELAVSVSRKLHAAGVIEKQFSRQIPILIHEYEYYDEIARQNERANPSEIIEEFVSWVDEI